MTLGSSQWHRGQFGGHLNAFGSILMTSGPSGYPSVALGLVWGPSQCLWIHLSGFGVDLGAISMLLDPSQWLWGRFGGHFNAFGSISVALGSIWGPSQCCWIHLSDFVGGLGAISMPLDPSQWLWGRFGGHFNAFVSIPVALGSVWGPSQCLWIHLSAFGSISVALGSVWGPSQYLRLPPNDFGAMWVPFSNSPFLLGRSWTSSTSAKSH